MKMNVTGQSAKRKQAARAGMTLIELLVALAVLSIMILLANALLIRKRPVRHHQGRLPGHRVWVAAGGR